MNGDIVNSFWGDIKVYGVIIDIVAVRNVELDVSGKGFALVYDVEIYFIVNGKAKVSIY